MYLKFKNSINTKSMVEVLNIGIDDDLFIEFQGIHNEVLNELQYIITWPNEAKFVMAFNEELGRLDIVGAAPYEAKERVEDIVNAIEAYQNGFFLI